MPARARGCGSDGRVTESVKSTGQAIDPSRASPLDSGPFGCGFHHAGQGTRSFTRYIWEKSMKSFQMKALAVAVLGLAGLGMAGSAFAACPDPTADGNQGYAQPDGPWSGEVVTNSTIAAGTPGLAGTSCKMVVAFTPSGGVVAGNSTAFVQDQSPNNEQRYRARFYVDFSGLAASFSTGSGSGEQLLLMRADASTAPAGRSTAVVRVYLISGSPLNRSFLVADSGAGGQIKTINVTGPNSSWG